MCQECLQQWFFSIDMEDYQALGLQGTSRNFEKIDLGVLFLEMLFLLLMRLMSFSSPHILEVRERIRINGKPLPKQKFADYFFECYDKLIETSVSFYHNSISIFS